MESAKKKTALLYLEPNKAFFYVQEIGSVLRFDFPQDVVSDLEITDKEKFEQIIDTFIKSNLKGLVYEVVLVLSQTVTFEKDILINGYKSIDTDIKNFLDIVPFEEILSKEYKLNKKIKIVTINKFFFENLRSVLEKNKLVISTVLPLSILQDVNTEVAAKLDLALIYTKIESFRQYNLLDYFVNSSGIQINDVSPQKQKMRTGGLVVVFIVLVIILGILVTALLLPQFSVKKKNIYIPKKSIPTPTVILETLETTPATESSDFNSTSSAKNSSVNLQ